jgi:hypothetical protein
MEQHLVSHLLITSSKKHFKNRTMKKLLSIGFCAIIAISSCRKIEVDGSVINNPNGTENSILEGRIKENRTLKASTTYKLRGLVYVTDGAVLTIEPGTKIVGETGQKGGLVITRNAKIIADGTVDKPIVFTSEAAVPTRGDWAGLVILGNAPTNASFNNVQGVGEIEGGVNNSDGLGLYGGTNPADNSGILRYVRVEYAGYAFLPDKEINGITFGGVGNQTIVDYVEVAYANDDSFEWFGGTVNCKHLIAYKGLDDELDTDNGFSGKVQFAICLRDSSVADISKSNGWESDNDANGSTLGPKTSAIFSNVTMVGPRATATSVGNSLFQAAAHLRRNSAQTICNSIMIGWPIGLLLDGTKGTPTDINIADSSLVFRNNIIAGCTLPVRYDASTTAPTGATTASITTWLSNSFYGNSILPNSSDAGLTAPYNYATPDFTPTASSPLLSGSSFANAKLSGLINVSYRGAVGPSGADATWWKGWSKF